MIRVNVTINREPKDVWAYITQPRTWVSWWGGGLSRVQPGWQTGGSLLWESGDTSPIDSLIPNKLLRIRAGYTNISIMLLPGGGASTVVEFEEDSAESGGTEAEAQFKQILERLKAGVESMTAAAAASSPVSQKSASVPPQAPPLSGVASQPPPPMSAAPSSVPPTPPASPSFTPEPAPQPAMPGAPLGGDAAPSLDTGLDPSVPLGDAPLPAGPVSDVSNIKVSNTGQRVAAILVVLIIIAGVVAVLVFLQRKQAEIEKHEAVKAAFQEAHLKGYVEFWKKVQVDVKGMKSNTEFEARLRQVTASPVRYAKHIKENALSVIDNAMPDYKAMFAKSPKEYESHIKALVDAMEKLRTEWDNMATEYLKFEDFLKAEEKLETASSHWLGWQQKPGTEKWKFNALKYIKVMRCIFKDKKWTDLDFDYMESEVTATCAKAAAKPDWFRRVAFECLPKLNGPPGEPDADFEAAVEASKKVNDTTSKLGIDTCLKKSRSYFESETIGKLGIPWAEYVKAQNALLDAVEANLEKLK